MDSEPSGDAGSDLGLPVDAELPGDQGADAAPDECVTDRDCPDEQLCGVTFPVDGGPPVVSCLERDEAGAPIGQPCLDGVLCVNGESCVAGICRQLCAVDGDCEAREVCSRWKLSGSGDPTDCDRVTVVSVCHVPCGGRPDCGASEMCFPVLKADRRATNGICLPARPGGATGEPCDGPSPVCEGELCLSGTACTERCGDATHCPDGFDCASVDGFAFSCLPSVAIPVCVPP